MWPFEKISGAAPHPSAGWLPASGGSTGSSSGALENHPAIGCQCHGWNWLSTTPRFSPEQRAVWAANEVRYASTSPKIDPQNGDQNSSSTLSIQQKDCRSHHIWHIFPWKQTLKELPKKHVWPSGPEWILRSQNSGRRLCQASCAYPQSLRLSRKCQTSSKTSKNKQKKKQGCLDVLQMNPSTSINIKIQYLDETEKNTNPPALVLRMRCLPPGASRALALTFSLMFFQFRHWKTWQKWENARKNSWKTHSLPSLPHEFLESIL